MDFGDDQLEMLDVWGVVCFVHGGWWDAVDGVLAARVRIILSFLVSLVA